ncbi:MAG: glycosyltransferase family 4 protein [Verrucomicrobiota bacterium]
MSYKLLIVSEPGVDGVFRHVEGLIRYLQSKGWKIFWAYSSVRKSAAMTRLAEEVKANGGGVLDLGVSNSPSFRDIGAYVSLWRFCCSNRVKWIHAHSSKAGLLARLIPFKRHIYTPHAYYGMGRTGGLMCRLSNLAEAVLGRIGKTISVSQDEKDFAARQLHIPETYLLTIPNAVDFLKFKPASDSEHKRLLRQEIEIDTNAWVVGSIGRICYQKDTLTLVKGFNGLCREFPQESFVLLLVGSGSPEEEAALAEAVSDLPENARCIRKAYRDNPEVYYQVMDAFALTSRYEGLPITALEALATDLPCIFTRVPGLNCFGPDGYQFNGIFYGLSGDEGSISKAFIDNYLDRMQSFNHRNTAKELFSIDQVYGEIESEYHQWFSDSPTAD